MTCVLPTGQNEENKHPLTKFPTIPQRPPPRTLPRFIALCSGDHQLPLLPQPRFEGHATAPAKSSCEVLRRGSLGSKARSPRLGSTSLTAPLHTMEALLLTVAICSTDPALGSIRLLLAATPPDVGSNAALRQQHRRRPMGATRPSTGLNSLSP
jgi:hypothetical protein